MAATSFPTFYSLNASQSGEPSVARPPNSSNQRRRVHGPATQSSRPRLPPAALWIEVLAVLDPIQSALAALTLRTVERGPLRRYAGGQARA